MAQIEVHSLSTPTAVWLPGEQQSFLVSPGQAAVFDAGTGGPPIIVQPTNPGGGGVILLAPHALRTMGVDELAGHARFSPNRCLLGIHDVPAIELEGLFPLAEHAAGQGRRLVLQIGDV